MDNSDLKKSVESNSSVVKAIRTYESDVAAALKNQKKSAVNIVASEQAKSRTSNDIKNVFRSTTLKREEQTKPSPKVPEEAKTPTHVTPKPAPAPKAAIMQQPKMDTPISRVPSTTEIPKIKNKQKDVRMPSQRPEIPEKPKLNIYEQPKPRPIQPLRIDPNKKENLPPIYSDPKPTPPPKLEPDPTPVSTKPAGGTRVVFDETISPPPKKSSSAKLIITFSVLLIVLGAGIIFLYNYYNNLRNEPPEISLVDNFIIRVDGEKQIDVTSLSPENVRQLIIQETKINLNRSSGGVYGIYFTRGNEFEEETLQASEIFPVIAPLIPDSLVRNLKDDFMFGIHRVDDNNPFLLFNAETYDFGFAGMLSWERNIANDLQKILFDTEILQSSFIDKVINNRDTRALLNRRGDIVMYYAFINNSTILVATHEDTLRVVFERLVAAAKRR